MLQPSVLPVSYIALNLFLTCIFSFIKVSNLRDQIQYIHTYISLTPSLPKEQNFSCRILLVVLFRSSDTVSFDNFTPGHFAKVKRSLNEDFYINLQTISKLLKEIEKELDGWIDVTTFSCST